MAATDNTRSSRLCPELTRPCTPVSKFQPIFFPPRRFGIDRFALKWVPTWVHYCLATYVNCIRVYDESSSMCVINTIKITTTRDRASETSRLPRISFKRQRFAKIKFALYLTMRRRLDHTRTQFTHDDYYLIARLRGIFFAFSPRCKKFGIVIEKLNSGKRYRRDTRCPLRNSGHLHSCNLRVGKLCERIAHWSYIVWISSLMRPNY